MSARALSRLRREVTCRRLRWFASAALPSTSEGVFELPNFALQSGETLSGVRLVYKTYGDALLPVILHPTSFDARHPDLEYVIGPGRILDTSKYRVVVPARRRGPSASQPHAAHPEHAGQRAVEQSQQQAARRWLSCGVCWGQRAAAGTTQALSSLLHALSRFAQHLMLTQHLGVLSLALVYGYSMGAMQALHFAALFPSFVHRVVATAGTASCGQYNAVFLEGLLAILRSSEEFVAGDGFCASPPKRALAAFGRVYAGWGLPVEWYRAEMWRAHGFASLEDFMSRSFEAWTVNADANDLHAMLRTWRAGNIGAAVGVTSDSEALSRITAKVVFCASPGDRYFPIEEIRAEAACIKGAQVVELMREWGHRAGDPHRPGQERDFELIKGTVAQLLAE